MKKRLPAFDSVTIRDLVREVHDLVNCVNFLADSVTVSSTGCVSYFATPSLLVRTVELLAVVETLTGIAQSLWSPDEDSEDPGDAESYTISPGSLSSPIRPTRISYGDSINPTTGSAGSLDPIGIHFSYHRLTSAANGQTPAKYAVSQANSATKLAVGAFLAFPLALVFL